MHVDLYVSAGNAFNSVFGEEGDIKLPATHDIKYPSHMLPTLRHSRSSPLLRNLQLCASLWPRNSLLRNAIRNNTVRNVISDGKQYCPGSKSK